MWRRRPWWRSAAPRPSSAPGSSSILGYRPCPLCLEQRYPYYFAIPLAVFIILGETVGSRRRILLAALAVIAGLMLWNAGLAGYHAGVEWKWWPGPNTCGGEPDLGTGGNLLKQLQSINVVRCDEAAWRFLGLSLAGYNVLISLALAAVAAWGFLAGLEAAAATDGKLDHGSSSVSQ